MILNALQFKNNVKLIATSLYMRSISRANYEKDDAEYVTSFLDIIAKNKSKFCNKLNANLPCEFVSGKSTLEKAEELEEVNELNSTESNILYSIAGYIITSIKKNLKTCKHCIQNLGSTHRNFSQYARLVRLRSYKNNTLFYVNSESFM